MRPPEMKNMLESGPVTLQYERTVPSDPAGELVPFHHFKIVTKTGQIAGHINFRIGNTEHVLLCAGHVGYEILPGHRANRYSFHACKALEPFIARHYPYAILTVDPANIASIRIIERLGASYINEIDVPAHDPAYAGGARRKRRYRWLVS